MAISQKKRALVQLSKKQEVESQLRSIAVESLEAEYTEGKVKSVTYFPRTEDRDHKFFTVTVDQEYDSVSLFRTKKIEEATNSELAHFSVHHSHIENNSSITLFFYIKENAGLINWSEL